MAPVNERVVRRSVSFADEALRDGFRYREAMRTGTGPLGWIRALGFLQQFLDSLELLLQIVEFLVQRRHGGKLR